MRCHNISNNCVLNHGGVSIIDDGYTNDSCIIHDVLMGDAHGVFDGGTVERSVDEAELVGRNSKGVPRRGNSKGVGGEIGRCAR